MVVLMAMRMLLIVVLSVALLVVSINLAALQSCQVINHVEAIPNTPDIRTSLVDSKINHTEASDCPSNNFCRNYKGILLIEHSDQKAAVGTLFFIHVINQLIYAQQHKLLPFVHLTTRNACFDRVVHDVKPAHLFEFPKGLAEINRISCKPSLQVWNYPGSVNYTIVSNRTYELEIHGSGIWSNYFRPVTEVDWRCCHQELPLVRMTQGLTANGIHMCAPWAIRGWDYKRLLPALKPRNSSTLEEWFNPMRRRGSEMVQHISPLPWLVALVDQANPPMSTCMALHIRLTDKGNGRTKIPLHEFYEYAKVYSKFVPEGHLFVATDDANVVDSIVSNWTDVARVRFQSNVQRSTGEKAIFEIYRYGRHRSNTECLVDLYAMSRCQYLVHGFSAMTEAIHYLRPHIVGINLDDSTRSMTLSHFIEYMEKAHGSRAENTAVQGNTEATTS